jgi:hypothetical protein
MNIRHHYDAFTIALKPLLRRSLWASLTCWFLFVTERFVYNVFDIGVTYFKVPNILLWLFLLPWSCYWFISLHSTLLTSKSRFIRVSLLGIITLLLAIGFLYASVMVFWSVADWQRAQFW